MKHCPYCAEEIQTEAKKCKHCGEWLDGSNKSIGNTVSNIFKKSASFVKEQKEKYQEKKYAHLYAPTDEKPMELNGAIFFSRHLEFNSNSYKYSEIISIKHFAEVNKANLITADTKNEFLLFLDIENSFPLEKRLNNRVIN